MVDCSGSLADALIAGKFFDAMVCPHSEILGLVVFGLIVYGAVGGSLYLFTGNAVMPLVLTLILGSVVVVNLPGPALQILGVFALLLLAAGGYFLVVSRGPARR